MSLESWLRLALAPEVGPVLGHRLLRFFGSPERIFNASERQLREVNGLGPTRLARLMDPATKRLAQEELARTRDGDVSLLTPADEDYPALLSRLENHPLILWVRGQLSPLDRLAVAIVGPRTASSYGRLMTRALAHPLASHGLTLVSGMAYGIDTETHRAAVESRGRTLAVLGQGLGTPVYPQANTKLAEQIVQDRLGALVSVFPMQTEPNPGNFPQRNEIIAGLALGVLVVEASSTSGALITARHAAAAGRPVLACPGDANRRSAQGSNRLIADGAFLVQTPEDVLAALSQDLRREQEALGSSSSAESEPHESAAATNDSLTAIPSPVADPLSRTLLDLLTAEPLPAELILERCLEQGHTAAAVHERLLLLEMDGLLQQMPGRLYALAHPSWR